MRILYFYQYFTTPQGSWSTRVYEFARRWVKAGDQVTVVTSVYDKSGLRTEHLIERLNIEGIDVRVIRIRLSQKHAKTLRLITYAAFSALSCWYALVHRADVVIASSGPLTVGIPGLLARYLRRKPLVFEVRDLWPDGAIQLGMLRSRLAIALARWLEARCYGAATRIVALSEGMADDVRRRSGRDVDVVPNACDNALFGADAVSGSLPEWTRGRHLVVYAGSIGLMDDCMQIMRMAQQLLSLGREDIQIVMIGDGKERPALQMFAMANGLTNVRFMGLLPKTETVLWLRNACCALITMKSVPVLDTVSPNKMFDAFAAGTPIVQTTQGWIKALIDREECGLTAPADDPLGFAEAVSEMARDGAFRAHAASQAKRLAKTLFDRDLLAGRMLEILREAASTR